ncbi:MAG: TolC family protein [Verrucomicrobiota bacterium]|nr:TolC family protein [Verrucomicrobiota bacterium]
MKFCTTIFLVMLGFRLAAQTGIATKENSFTNFLSLESVVNEVLSNNPSLKAARANWEAMKERVPQARAWDDARLGFDATAGRFVSVPQNSFSDQKVMAEQTIPVTGKNRLRGQASNAEAAGAFAEFHRRELDFTAKARIAFFRLANARAQLELNRKNSELLKQFSEITRRKYEAGTQSQSDFLSAETEVAKLQENTFDFRRQISDAETQLNILMNRPANAPLAAPENLVFQSLIFAVENIETNALAHRPELLIAQKKIEAAQARLEASRREWIPEPSLRVEAVRYHGAAQPISEVMAGISFNLPWFNHKKYSAAIRENKKMLESAEHELEAARTETVGMVRDQLKKIDTFHHHAELFRNNLLPLARQTADSKRLSYETDKAGFFDLLTSQKSTQEIEAMYLNHLTEYRIAVAELESLVGIRMENFTNENKQEEK